MSPYYYLAKLTHNKKTQLKYLLLADKLTLANDITYVGLKPTVIKKIVCQKIKENNTATLKYLLERMITNTDSIVYHSRELGSIETIKFVIDYEADPSRTQEILKNLVDYWDGEEPTEICSWAKKEKAISDELDRIEYNKQQEWYEFYEFCRLDNIEAVIQYHLSGGDINRHNHEMLFKCMKNDWTLAAEYLCEFCDEDGLFNHFPHYLLLRDFKRNKKALYDSLNKNLDIKNHNKKIKI